MQGTIAQLLCLVTHGNSFLAGQALQEFWPGNSTFRHCSVVRFMDLEPAGDGWAESLYADNPWRWIEALKKSGVTELKAIHVPRNDDGLADRLSAGLPGGGGRWLLECVTPAGSDLWESRWEAGDRDDAGQETWQVSYGRVAKAIATPPQPQPSLPGLHRDLAVALAAIRDFADSNEQRHFGECFDRGLRALSGMPTSSRHRVAPPGWLSLAAEQLLAACQGAWVFGGKGGWNGIGFSDADTQGQYEALSDRLFSLLNMALVAAVNSRRPPPGDAAQRPEEKPSWWKIW